MSPFGLRSRNFADRGEVSPSGCRSSIFVFGSSMKTTVMPWSGCAVGAETRAPRVSQ